jgi:hypothetical protein
MAYREATVADSAEEILTAQDERDLEARAQAMRANLGTVGLLREGPLTRKHVLAWEQAATLEELRKAVGDMVGLTQDPRAGKVGSAATAYMLALALFTVATAEKVARLARALDRASEEAAPEDPAP